MNLVALDPKKIASAWPFVRAGCEKVLAKTNDRWIPEDVYMEVRSGSAFLYMIEHESDEIGFIVVRRVMDPDGPVLFVWIMWTEPGLMAESSNWKAVIAELDALARSIGAKRIRHYSSRSGFEEHGAFTLKMHIYERET
jgi:hypothetical protein